jgi:hypothetical protein
LAKLCIISPWFEISVSSSEELGLEPLRSEQI